MAEKHYHNDYKKLMGVDETRTASEKLLDRTFRQKQFVPSEQQIEKIQKKVKRESEQELTNEKMILKIIMSIKNNVNNAVKLDKALGVLDKCLDSEEFKNSIKNQQIQQIVIYLIQNQGEVQGTLGEKMKLSEKLVLVIKKIMIIIEKNAQNFSLLIQKLKFSENYLGLVNDDNFTFAKQLLHLKQQIFSFYKQVLKEESQNQLLKVFVQKQILMKLLKLPNLHLEWVRTSITNFFKQFLNEFKSSLMNQKQFLKEYNKFLQQKKTSKSEVSYNIMGNKGSVNGGSYEIVQTQDAADAWCKRQ